jgi:hypothetical protein
MGLWNQTKPEALRYIDDLNEEWMATAGYEGEYWEDRRPVALDPNEYPARGLTYTQATDLTEFMNLVLTNTNGVSLIAWAVRLWVNYGEAAMHRYAPIQAFGGFGRGDWNSLLDFYILAGTPESGPALHHARRLYGLFQGDPTQVISSFASGELGIRDASVVHYNPGWAALANTFQVAWDRAIKSPNSL